MHRVPGLCMFVLTRVRPVITDLKTDTVATGIGGVYGNKGACYSLCGLLTTTFVLFQLTLTLIERLLNG